MLTALEWLLDRSSGNVAFVGDDVSIVHTGRGIEQTLGYPRRGLLGFQLDALVAAECRTSLLARCSELFSEATAPPHVSLQRLMLMRSDGTATAATLDLDVVSDAGRRLLAACFIEENPTRSFEHFSTALEAAPSGMVLVDEYGSIVYVNSNTERLFGYARGELIGEKIERLVPERYRTEHVGSRDTFLQDARTRAMGAGRDLYGLRRDHSEVPIEIGLNAVTLDGRRYVLSSIVNVTERKRALDHLDRRSKPLRPG